MFSFMPPKPMLENNEENLQVVNNAIKALNELIAHYENKERFKDAAERSGIKLVSPWSHSLTRCNGSIGIQITGCVQIKMNKLEDERKLGGDSLINDLLYSIGFRVCDSWSYTSELIQYPMWIDDKRKICEIVEKCHKIIKGKIPEEVQIAHLKSLFPSPDPFATTLNITTHLSQSCNSL
jgi:hypothetical protein